MAGGNHEIIERVSHLEALIGTVPEGEVADYNLMEKIAYLEASIDEIRGSLMEELMQICKDNETLHSKLVVLRRAVSSSAEHPKDRPAVKVPEPKAYGGARSAKELKNYLWDMEQYFLAARVLETEKVTISSMYLGGDAKLWWRTRMVDDVDAGREKIDTWARLKKELKVQFLPGNVSWVARDKLKSLKQKGSVRDYVKEFTSLMLDISNMSEEDKLYNFLYGLQPWAQIELRRQNVRDLLGAIIAADALADFRSNKESLEPSYPPKILKNRKVKEVERKKDAASSRRNSGKDHSVAQGNNNMKSQGCFLCNGPHLVRECPKREKKRGGIYRAGWQSRGDNAKEGGPPTEEFDEGADFIGWGWFVTPLSLAARLDMKDWLVAP
ncbi:hypothetical protein ZIOFF_032615 [Zingiber officinale]|uniref:Retrotransposon gag domain-containing protein n=1 Tax=Zingiber officinale TaxID=94328 RepID=A0A8J5GNX0_ZINOF|nr:hypothetical protein ZIOFF_032615 [Zingiber officinale]